MQAHFLTPVVLHELSRIDRCQQHVSDWKWSRNGRSLLESQLPLEISLLKRMCALRRIDEELTDGWISPWNHAHGGAKPNVIAANMHGDKTMFLPRLDE